MARRWAAPIVALAIVVAVPGLAGSQASEQDIKAAFLYHFAQYVEWPATAFESATSPFVLGVVGDDGFLPAISSAVADKSIAGHRIVVKSVRAPAEARACHMVFLTTPQASRPAAMLEAIEGLPVLAVGDAPRFADAGGAIAFLFDGGKVSFRINTATARHAGLRISSKLLRLAEIVDAD
jgi:hypothetical protein